MRERFSVSGVDAGTPLHAAAPAMLVAKAEPFFRLEDAARSGADVEAVHDMRVASRRLREAMRLFAPLYPGRAFARWYSKVRRVTRSLGPVRDADVFIETFGALSKQLEEPGRRAVAFLVGQRLGQRERQLELLDRQLENLDLRLARKEFARLSAAVEADGQARRPLSEFAYAQIAERAALVMRLQPDSLAESQIANQHALRILYKRLRYAVEVFATCYGDRFDAIHDVLTAIQDALGDLHDNHLFLDLVADPAVIAAAARAGVTEADLEPVAAALRARAREAYERFIALESQHPSESMLPQLLIPLTQRFEPAASDAAAPSEAASGTEADAEAESADTEMPEDPEALDVRLVADKDDKLPYLTGAGELVIPDDGVEIGPWDDDEPAVAGDRGPAL
jgi:CHAD domain-containing protein